jgi:hypothetical protein
MKKFLTLATGILLLAASSFGQFSQRSRDSINQLTEKDYDFTLKQLGITEMRHGPSGNPADANAANADESKATTYTSLPDPLRFDNGKTVAMIADWEKRKVEIAEHFNAEMYGRMPQNTPKVTWVVVSEKDTLEGDMPVKVKVLKGKVDNSSFPSIEVAIDMTLTLPAKATQAVPVIMEFGWIFPANMRRPQQEGPTGVQQVLAKGWGFAVLVPTSFQADNGAGLRSGIIGLVNKGQPRKADDWGTLRAWAWGASRAIDYFETDAAVDAKRVAIEGLSRYGKAALVAIAFEPRIAVGFIGSSGAGGAKILRRTFGEQVENLTSSSEYHWFAPNFIKYGGPLTVNDMPVDAHQLVALCAPRPVFISVGSPFVEGNWIDAKGTFLGGVHAGPVYRLFGKKDLGTSEFPPLGTNLADGDVAFRQHEGGHTVEPNWPYFIAFAQRYFK